MSYQKLTAALLNKLSVILLLTIFKIKIYCFHRLYFIKGRLNVYSIFNETFFLNEFFFYAIVASAHK